MFKIPHNESLTIKISEPSIAPAIAASITPPFAYVAKNPEGVTHAREIFENANISVTVTSACQLDEKTPILPEPFKIKVGQNISVKDFTQKLVDYGYARVTRIENEGEFSARGDTVDLFAKQEFRIMFFGDEVEKIRASEQIKEITIPPIPDHCLVKDYATKLQEIKRNFPIIILEEHNKLDIWVNPQKEFHPKREIEIKTASVANFFSNYSILVPEILWNIKTRAKTVIIYVGTSKALERYLDTKGIPYTIITPDNITPHKINIVRAGLGVSFELVDLNTVVYSVGSPKVAESVQAILSEELVEGVGEVCLEDLRVGCLIWHEKHGLGRYLGTKEMALGDTAREYLVLQYDGGAFVYLPKEQIHQLYNYVGPARRLDRI